MPSGQFLDPRGFTITLQAKNEHEYRQLVTKKLDAGWKQLSPVPVAPLRDVQLVGLGPPKQPEPPAPELVLPSLEERQAAAAEVLTDDGWE